MLHYTLMLYYFRLQYLRNIRRIADFGLNPLLAIALVSSVFIGCSFYIFTLDYSHYIYTALAVVSGYSINRTRSTSIIKNLFSQKQYRWIGVIENIILAFPFVLFLLAYHFFASAMLVVIAALSNTLIGPSKTLNFTLPTPFSRHPFEFSVGFRKSFLVFVIHAFLMYKAVEVNNFNLGLFALLMVFFCACSFFFGSENAFFVWIFKHTPAQFLRYKIFIACIYYFILLAPSAFILLAYFPDNGYAILIGCALSLPYLVAVVLAKYAAFPNEIQLPQLIFLGLSLAMPPFLMLTLPRFYKQAVHQLKTILAHD